MITSNETKTPAYTGPVAQEGSDPREFFRILWRRKWVLLICLTVIPLAVYVYSDRLTKSYQTSAILQVQPTAVDESLPIRGDFTSSSSIANTAKIAALIETNGVADEAARILKEPPGSLRGSVVAKDDEDTGFITTTATAASGQRAARIANAFAEAVQKTRREQGIARVNAAIANTENELARLPSREPVQREQLSENLQNLRSLRAAQDENAQVIQAAGVPSSPVSPKPKRNAVLALVVSLLIGAAAVLLAERLDRRLHEARDLERLTGTPLLAQVPATAFPGAAPDPQLPIVFQTLRDSLTYFNVDQRLTSLLVISPTKGDGKTSVATNLAVAFARAGKQVVLVDADLRSPQVAPRMGAETAPGLSEVLSANCEITDALQEIEPFGSYLRVLPGGSIPPNPSEMLGSARMSSVLADLTELSDLTLIDTPPVLVVSDAFPLFDQVAGIVGVARLEQTQREGTERAIEVARNAGGRVLGMVATGGRPAELYALGYGYGYGQTALIPEAESQFVQSNPANGNGTPAPKAEASVGRRVRQFFRSS